MAEDNIYEKISDKESMKVSFGKEQINEIMNDRALGNKVWYLYVIGSVYLLVAIYLSYILVPLFYSNIVRGVIIILMFSPCIPLTVHLINMKRNSSKEYDITKKEEAKE